MRLFPRPILPVLMYHRFGSADRGDPALWVSLEQFGDQLRWLREHRYRTLSLDSAYRCLRDGRVPRRTVLITIDDGFADDLERAARILEKESARASVFVPSGLLGQTVDFGHPDGDSVKTSSGTLADEVGLRRWLDRGFEVGCHSLTHLDLTGLEAETLRQETEEARRRLSSALDHPILDFCYPFAHHDEAARAAVAAAGYRAAYAGEPPREDVFAAPRMMVYPGDSEARFRRKVSGYYYWISELHQNLRRFVRN